MKFNKSKLPSRHVSLGVKSAGHRSMYYAMGLKKEDIEKNSKESETVAKKRIKVGLILNIVSATLGATLLFLAVRLGFKNFFRRFEKRSARFSILVEQLKVNEVNILLLLRLMPVVPFFIANILPAIAGVSLKNFLWTTFFGIIPGGFVFALIGSNAGKFFDRGEAPDLTIFWSLEFLGPLICLIILVAFPMFVRIARYNHD